MSAEDSATPRPELKIINPDATPEEIAAVTAVIAAMGAPTAPAQKPTSTWASRQRRSRPALRAGAGAWRASGLPR